MGAFANSLAQRNRELRKSVDTQSFTYGFEVWVPLTGTHQFAASSANQGGEQPWPGGPTPPNYPGDTPVYSLGTWPRHQGIASLLFRIEQDAHFRIDQVTASVYGLVPWDSAANFQNQSGAKRTAVPGGLATLQTRYPFPDAVASLDYNKAERGVSVKIYDQSKVVRELTSDYTPMEVLFPPGYGLHIAEPLLSGYVLEKQHTLRLDFQNRDYADGSDQYQSDDYHVVKIAFTGRQFYTD